MSILKPSSLILFLCCCIAFSTSNCDKSPRTQGKVLYEVHCANCHQPDGSGLIGNIPPLADADWVKSNTAEIACVIRYGMQGPMMVNGLKYNAVMAGTPTLTDAEITNVINYILESWGNDMKPIGATQVSNSLDKCKDRELIRLANPQDLSK